MSPIVAAFVWAALVPAIVVTIAVFLTGTLKESLRARLHAVFLAAGFFAGTYVLLGRMNFPPLEAIESIAYCALLLALFVVIFPMPYQAPYIVRAVVVAAVGGLLLWHIRSQLVGEVYTRNMIAFYCLGLGTWSIYERNCERVHMLTLITLPLISATGLSFILLFGASASFSQLVTILCAALGGMAVIALVKPGYLSKGALVPFLSIFVIVIMAAGHFYLAINPWKMVALCFPYLLVWTRRWMTFLPTHPIAEAAILSVAAAAPLAYFMYESFKSAGPLY